MLLGHHQQSHLRVTEEEDHGFVFQPSLYHDITKIFPPLRHAIVLGQLNLETVILHPAGSKIGLSHTLQQEATGYKSF